MCCCIPPVFSPPPPPPSYPPPHTFTTFSDWVSEGDFSSSLDFWITTNQALNQCRGTETVSWWRVWLGRLEGAGRRWITFLHTNQPLSQAWTIRTGFRFQAFLFISSFISPCCAHKLLFFYHRSTGVGWVKQFLSHYTACNWDTMSLIRNLTVALWGIM